MKRLAFTLSCLMLVACSANGTSPTVLQNSTSEGLVETTPARTLSSSGGIQFTVYGSPTAFKQTKGENGIAYDAMGGVWISSPTAFEHRSGSSAYVIGNGLQPTSADDYWHSVAALLPFNGYVYAVGFKGAGLPAFVRIASNGSRSVYPITGLGDPVYGFISVAAGPHEFYALWLDNTGSAQIPKLVRISPQGAVLSETVLQPLNSYANFLSVGVAPAGDVYVVQGDQAYPYTSRIDRYSESGAFERSYATTTFSPGGVAQYHTSVAVGTDGNVYVPGGNPFANDCILVLNPTTGTQTCDATPTQGSLPMNAVLGNDGNVWFVEYEVGKLARMNTAGQITEYPEPLPNPLFLAAAPKTATENPPNSLWFTSDTDRFDSVRATY